MKHERSGAHSLRRIAGAFLAVLLVPGLAAGEPPPLERSLSRTPFPAKPALPFTENGGWTLAGGSALTPGAGPDNATALAVPAGGSAVLALPVPRGGVFNKGVRYLVTARVNRETAESAASLSAASGGGSSTAGAASTGAWEELAAFADTAHWLPGRDTDTLAITLSSSGRGRALFDQVQLFEIPAYGIHFRFRVLDPAAGAFQAAVSIIRRHRDTSHHDPIRHYYHSSLSGLGGPKGLSAGRFSDWVDLRPYLFGQGVATVGIQIHPAGRRDAPIPVRVALELAFAVDRGHAKPGEERATGPEALRRDDGDSTLHDVLADTLGEALSADAVETARVFFRTERHTSNGVLGFLMPENNVLPGRLFDSLVSLDADAERRQAWVPGLPPASAGTGVPRILTGANFFAVDNLVSPETARLEADLLARIGIRVCADPAFRHAQRARRGRDTPVEFLYGRLGKDDWYGASPYAGDALETKLNEKYRAFAATLTNGAACYIELQDEPGNLGAGAADQTAFRAFLTRHGVTPAMVGAAGWEQVQTFGYAPPSVAAFTRPEGPARGLAASPDEEGLEVLREDADFDTGAEGEKETEQDGSATRLPLEQRRRLYYTRLFSAQKTADLLAAATRAVHAHIPNSRTLVNFRSGVRQVLTPETADWFLIGRQRAVDVMWNEDWVNTYGWRRDGIQSVSYYTELMRTAARKHDLPVGGFLMCYWDQAERKAWSALAHGSRFIHFWRYGPHYANYLPYSWSGSSSTVAQIAQFCRDVERLEPTLAEAAREPARVALLYAKSDPVWGRGQTEHRLLFFALLHAQIPVDLVTEAEIVEDGLLQRYDYLYIGDVSVQRAALDTIAGWVAAGGRLFLSGDAATRDEFNEPADVIPGPRPAPPADGAPLQATNAVGKGLVCVNASQPGLHYLGTVVRERGQLQRGWDPERRRWITGFALDTGLARPVEADLPCVEAILYRHPREDIVILINYTGSDLVPAVRVTVRCATRVTAVESLRQGLLPFQQKDKAVSFSMPLAKGDAIVLRHE